MSRRRSKIVPIAAIAVVLTVVAGTYAYVAFIQPQPGPHLPSNELTSYGRITALDYQGTSVSMVFTSDTAISLYTAAISYTANNHANSNQFYQRGQTPIGAQPVYNLQKGEDVNMTFVNFPAGSLLLNIVVQVNATVGSHTLLLNYNIPQLETNSTQ